MWKFASIWILYLEVGLLLSLVKCNNIELHPADGYYNNLFNPDWGITGNQLRRLTPPDYSDGAYEPSGVSRPNPLVISDTIHRGRSGMSTVSNKSALMVFFGQLVADEIINTGNPGCPPEYTNIEIPDNHLYRQKATHMTYERSGYDARTGSSPNRPRQQTNSVTPFLDAGFLYGTTQFFTNQLREFRGGRLLSNDGTSDLFPAKNDIRLILSNPAVPRDHSLKPSSRFFRIGNARGHMNPYLLTMQIIWYRWHNYLANDLSTKNRDWKDERLFYETKKRVTAQFQKIVMEEWLPVLLPQGNIPPYDDYKNYVHPGASQEFQTAMEAYISTLLPAGVWTLGENCARINTTSEDPDSDRQVEAVRLCNTYWDSQDLVQANFNSLLRGMLYTKAEPGDTTVVPDVREYYPGPYEFSRRDQVAVLIQQGRDHGLSDYNTIRQGLGFQPITRWENFNTSQEIVDKLRQVYGNNTSDLDLFTGGLLELSPSGPGEVFQRILVDQFTRIRDGDRFWYEKKGFFTEAELEEIRSTTFADILRNVTDVRPIFNSVFNCQGLAECSCADPPNVDNNNNTRFDVCSELQTYDYFTGSEVSFILSFLAIGLVIPGSILVLMLLIKRRQKIIADKSQRMSKYHRKSKPNSYLAEEWLGANSESRKVKIELHKERKKINVANGRGQSLRFIDLRRTEKIQIKISYDKQLNLASVRVPGDIDLILRFSGLPERQNFVTELETFLRELSIEVTRQEQAESVIISTSNNRDDRQKVLDEFFRVVCLQALKKDPTTESFNYDAEQASQVINVKLTRTEFADALGLQPSSIFVRNIFLLGDKDNDGFMCFREFLDLFAVFARGTADEKARLMFNIYDVKRKGILERSDFIKMIKSLLDLSDAKLGDDKVNELIDVMYREAGLNNRNTMTFDDFKKVFTLKEYEATFQSATIGEQGGTVSAHAADNTGGIRNRRHTLIKSYKGKKDGEIKSKRNSKVRVKVERPQPVSSTNTAEKIFAITKFMEIYRLQIFWLLLYTLVTIGIFIERAYYYAEGREHAGLRRLSGAWTTAMIRGSASVIMFTYSSLLLTMCRNIITRLRETFLHRFIPFDSAVDFHKYIAVVAMIGTIVHIFGHATNLYCIVTQPPQDVTCLFREYYRGSNELATFHYWAFQTITGLAGVYVTILIFIMYVFATQYARRNIFTAFWFTHGFYIFVYPLTFLHGVGVLVQAPLFPWFLIGPLVLFVLDKLASISRNKVEIRVKKVSILPSDVTELVFKRPANFDYKSGQWVRIACLKLGKSEYHPFTLTSAPHEENLSLHIRAVGPWTKNLRQLYERKSLENKPLPMLYVDGPFGEGHQDWFTFDVAVLVGGGIGVTPFASILKDIAFKSKSGLKINCKKVYFVWITRTQKHFEWLIDIIRDVEDQDVNDIVNVHIFVTQFQQKYDLRTTMLYICERNFQKVENKSLFTGLRAVTHFGRPKMTEFLQSLHYEYPGVERFGVFSCGPGPMTNSVQASCTLLNSVEGPTYHHHFENF